MAGNPLFIALSAAARLASWGATKVIIEMEIRNNASFRLAESLGAKRVAFKPKAQLLKGEWSDEYQYEILSPLQ